MVPGQVLITINFPSYILFYQGYWNNKLTCSFSHCTLLLDCADVHKKKFPFMLELWFFISWYVTFPGRVFLVKASYSTLNPSEVTLQNYLSLFTLISESIFRYVTSNITQVFGIRIYTILPNISFFWYLGVIQQCFFSSKELNVGVCSLGL